MKKLFKKSISCIVAVLMVLSSMPFTALTANAALVKQDIAVWDAANVTTATPGTGTKFTHTDSSTKVSINGVHWGSASKADGNGYVTFNNATISSEAGFSSLNIKGDVWTFSSKFATTGEGLDDQNTQQTTNDDSTIFGIGTATTRTYSPSGAVKTSGMAADLVNITKNGNIYLAGSSTSSGTVANVLSSSADDAKILTVAYDNGNLTISLDGTTAYTGTVDTALFSQGVSNFFIGTSAQVYAGGKAPYYGLTNDGYYTYGTHLYSLSASVSVDLSTQITETKREIDNTGFAPKTGSKTIQYYGTDVGIPGVLYTDNTYRDATNHVWNLSGNNNTNVQAKIMAGAGKVVYLYSGDKSVIQIPCIAEYKRTGGTLNRYKINYLAPNGVNSTDWAVVGQWDLLSAWNSWSLSTSSTYSGDGIKYISSDPSHDVTGFSSNDGEIGTNSSMDYRALIKYTGTLTFDANGKATLTNPRFKTSVDGYATWAFGGKSAYNNVDYTTKTNNTIAFGNNDNNNLPVYTVFNYVPMVEKLAAAQTKYDQVKANESNYTPASVLNFYNAVKGLIDYNPNSYDFSTDDAFATATAAMKRAIANYDNAVLVDAVKTYTVTFADAMLNQKTVKVREGATVPADQFPTLTSPRQLSNKTQHTRYYFKNIDDGTEFTATTVVTSNISVIESSITEDCSGGTATCQSKAICSICGAEYGDVDSNNHTGLVSMSGKDATCSEDGYSAYQHCNDCGVDVGKTVIPATNHSWGDWTSISDTQHQRVCANDPSHHVETEQHNIVNGACTKCDYVAFDMATYNSAVKEYEEIIGAGDYAEKYTEASRTAYQEAVEAAKRDSFATKEEVDAAVAAILSAKTKLVYAKADVDVYIAREGVEPVLVETISKNYGETADINVADKLSAGEQILKWVIETQDTKVNTKLATTDTTVSMVVTEPADVYVHIATEKSTEAVQYSKVSFISKNGAVSFVKYVPAGTTLYTNTVDGVEIPFYEFKNWDKASVTADGSNIEVKAVYEFVGEETNKCNVHYNGTTKTYTYDSFVYLFGAEDKTLALSTDGTVENIITYLNENAFYAPHTKDIYVIEVNSPQPASIGITGSYASSTDTKKTAAFNCKFFLPAGCTVVEYGLTATSSTGKSMKIKAEAASARGEYCIKVSMAKTSPVTSVEGVAYLTYKDAENYLHTIYSTPVTQNL